MYILCVYVCRAVGTAVEKRTKRAADAIRHNIAVRFASIRTGRRTTRLVACTQPPPRRQPAPPLWCITSKPLPLRRWPPAKNSNRLRWHRPPWPPASYRPLPLRLRRPSQTICRSTERNRRLPPPPRTNYSSSRTVIVATNSNYCHPPHRRPQRRRRRRRQQPAVAVNSNSNSTMMTTTTRPPDPLLSADVITVVVTITTTIITTGNESKRAYCCSRPPSPRRI